MAKDKNRFQLRKDVGADPQKENVNKSRFNLSKDLDESEVATPVQDQQTVTAQEPVVELEKRKGLRWVKIVLAIVLLALVVWFLTRSCSNESTEITTETEQLVPSDVTKDSVATDAPAQEVEPAPETVSDVVTETTTAPASKTAATPAEDVDAEAMKVIRGEYGAGAIRKNRLGERYVEIQRRVNQLKRQGVF